MVRISRPKVVPKAWLSYHLVAIAYRLWRRSFSASRYTSYMLPWYLCKGWIDRGTWNLLGHSPLISLLLGVIEYRATILVSRREVLLEGRFCVVRPPPFSSKVSFVRNMLPCNFASFSDLYGSPLIPCHLFDVPGLCRSRKILCTSCTSSSKFPVLTFFVSLYISYFLLIISAASFLIPWMNLSFTTYSSSRSLFLRTLSLECSMFL